MNINKVMNFFRRFLPPRYFARPMYSKSPNGWWMCWDIFRGDYVAHFGSKDNAIDYTRGRNLRWRGFKYDE